MTAVTHSVTEEVPAIRWAYTLSRFDPRTCRSASAPTEASPKGGTVHARRLTIKGPSLAPGSCYLALGLGRGDQRTEPIEYDIVMDNVSITVDPRSNASGAAVSRHSGWDSVRLPDPIATAIAIAASGSDR